MQTEDFMILRNRLRELLDDFERDYPGFWARIVRGDSIECVVPEYRYALRIAILIKLFVKIQAGGFDCDELLQRHGIRFSIGIADISYADKAEDMINGSAIYMSGRNLDEISRRDLYTAMEVEAVPKSLSDVMDSYVALMNYLVDSYSIKQAEVVFYKLRGYKEVDISKRLSIYQSAVNMRSTSAQWRLLNTAIKDYEDLDFRRICG